jgi:UDP-2,3-diacylglucosamine pyrophosphatase LpxH
MTRIAHISDLHLLEDDLAARSFKERLRLSFLTFGRSIDAIDRRARVARALRSAWEAKADHLVVTGDLTEDGIDVQFEMLAESLRESDWPAHRVTLVPGNHDAYHVEDAWALALAGPLADWAATSELGSVIEVDEVGIVPVSTAFHQPVTRSAGRIDPELVQRLESIVIDDRWRGRPLLFTQHHAPIWRGAIHWVDGLMRADAIARILSRSSGAHVLCGHVHKPSDKPLFVGEPARIFTAAAVVDSDAPVRLYDVCEGRLNPVDEAAERASAAEALALVLRENEADC